MAQPTWFDDLQGAAKWIWHDQPLARNDTALFYARVDPPAGTTQIELHVSADNRYVLWAIPHGGKTPAMSLGRGPARGDVQHKSLDSYGLNVAGAAPLHLYAQVRWMPGQPEAPMAEVHSSNPGFLCIVLFYDDAGRIIGKTGTGESWKALATTGIEATHAGGVSSFYCIGMMEHQRASGWPEDWLSPAGAASAAWGRPRVSSPPYFRPDPEMCWSPNDRPWLIPRQIAHAEQISRVPMDIRDAQGGGAVSFPLTLAAGQTRRLRIDMGEMVLAYPAVRFAGKQAQATIIYAEVLLAGNGHGDGKSFTLDSNYAIRGYADTFINDVGTPRRLTLSHWRSFRFLEVVLTAGPETAVFEELFLEGTGYPFENGASFEAPGMHADIIAKTVDVSWRTIKCCTWETYMDCPYYEQLQYVGDTRLQCLITYVTTADPTLPAQALRAFDRSRIPEGLTQSRTPCTGMQLIPTFSLIYIVMIEDYLDWVGDEGLVAELRPGIAPILNWFSQYADRETGLITMPDFWPFVDWVATWPKGNPPAAPNRDGQGVSALVNLHMLLALDAASRIYERAKPGSGNLYFTRANVLRQKIYDTFYHAPTGLIADVPVDHRGNPATGGRAGTLSFSQHAQALAVLADVLKATEARKALTWAMAHAAALENAPSAAGEAAAARPPQFRLAPASLYFRFYLAEALAKMGMGEHFWDLLAPFRDALVRGSTTWPEAFEPARSECHAWSSWPLYFLHRHVLGVHPPDPADGRIEVAPLQCAPLEKVRGRTMTHRGPVDVEIDWTLTPPAISAQGPGTQVRPHHARA